MKKHARKLLKYLLIAGVFFLLGFSWSTAPDSVPGTDLETGSGTKTLSRDTAGGDDIRQTFQALPDKCTFRTVTRVIDGDTVELGNGKRVRFIGIDTPELHSETAGVEFYAEEASDALESWVEGKSVCLKTGSGDKIDKYDRLLRYVYLGEVFVNAKLVREGYAEAYTRYPFDYKEEFLALESEAKNSGRGMWDESAKAEYFQTKSEESVQGTCEEGTICPNLAIRHIGEYGTVRFFVTASHDSGAAIFFNSMESYKNPKNFTAVIFNSDRSKFPENLAEYYANKMIEVTGTIKRYDGRAEIVLESPSQVRVAE